ncbi:MAG: glycosyltransferase family 2 protein [Candidatus Levybacteria bacterium]|nr:glycosyltransferase family 2 protein [Candidatus Levybacteria bacterium]
MIKNNIKSQELSVVLATFNEENNLFDCLDSVKNLADEIIVVDGSSIDKTAEIARKYGAKVAIVPNLKNFHINKQKAIDLATKDWILQLDADERVSNELVNEIKSKLKNRDLPVNGYWIARKNSFLGRFLKKGGQYPDYTLRLYRRGKGRLPQVHVHEQAKVEGSVGYLQYPLLHFPYKNFASYYMKWNRYNDLLAGQIGDSLKNKSFLSKIFYGIGYMVIKPAHWFLTTYIRHKGFMDLWPGFVFSFFSALRFPVSYLRYLKVL